MSMPVLVMNAVLTALLLAALAFGWRLDRRLKALKASHESFAKAVADLDGAAARAEQGLADLRGATEEASERLQERIETARRLAGRLDAALHAAPQLEAQADAVAAQKAARATPPKGRDERPLTLFETRAPQPPPRPAPPEPARSRARVDDDLFEPEAGSRLTAILGGRR